MGFSLTDVFTGQPGKDAAEQNKALLAKTQADIAARTNASKGTAADYLNTGFDSAGSNLALGYGAANSAINGGATGAINYLDAGTQGALDQFGRARTDLTNAGNAYAPLTDLAGNFREGSRLYGDALGLNGDAGNTRATSAFHAGPGYQFAVDQGLNAITRAHNASGTLNSGSTDVDALKFGQGLADQQYQSWLTNLSPYNNLSLSATQGAAAGTADASKSLAALDTGTGNLLSDAGKAKASVASGQGSSLADIASRYYSGRAGLDTSRGSALAGNEMGATGAINSADLNLAPQIGQQNTAAANAQLAGSSALWSAIMGGANMGLKATGVGGFGAPSMSLANLGGSPSGNAFMPSQAFMNNSWGF